MWKKKKNDSGQTFLFFAKRKKKHGPNVLPMGQKEKPEKCWPKYAWSFFFSWSFFLP